MEGIDLKSSEGSMHFPAWFVTNQWEISPAISPIFHELNFFRNELKEFENPKHYKQEIRKNAFCSWSRKYI